jgi:hypothetical protein
LSFVDSIRLDRKTSLSDAKYMIWYDTIRGQSNDIRIPQISM